MYYKAPMQQYEAEPIIDLNTYRARYTLTDIVSPKKLVSLGIIVALLVAAYLIYKVIQKSKFTGTTVPYI